MNVNVTLECDNKKCLNHCGGGTCRFPLIVTLDDRGRCSNYYHWQDNEKEENEEVDDPVSTNKESLQLSKDKLSSLLHEFLEGPNSDYGDSVGASNFYDFVVRQL